MIASNCFRSSFLNRAFISFSVNFIKDPTFDLFNISFNLFSISNVILSVILPTNVSYKLLAFNFLSSKYLAIALNNSFTLFVFWLRDPTTRSILL